MGEPKGRPMEGNKSTVRYIQLWSSHVWLLWIKSPHKWRPANPADRGSRSCRCVSDASSRLRRRSWNHRDHWWNTLVRTREIDRTRCKQGRRRRMVKDKKGPASDNRRRQKERMALVRTCKQPSREGVGVDCVDYGTGSSQCGHFPTPENNLTNASCV